MRSALRLLVTAVALTTASFGGVVPASALDVAARVRDHYADHDGVKIHYVTAGRGPLVVLIHGFPDFWYGWREQILPLSRRHRVIALDQRGYNLSDQPKGVENYDVATLAGDVAAVIRDAGGERATIVGHDWGGAVAWTFAMLYPEMTESLVVLQTPHPRGLLRELRTNPKQEAISAYARNFQKEGAHLALTAEGLAGLVADPVARARYVEAYSRSDFEAMLNYYKRNYPRPPYADLPLPPIQAPVLVLHGLDDPFLLASGHNGTWDWVDAPVTLQMVPGVGHFIQWDRPDIVNRALLDWLQRDARRDVKSPRDP